jgi:outer membrane lipoprotein-sorting protein
MENKIKSKLTRKILAVNLLVSLALIIPAMLLGAEEGSGTAEKALAKLNKTQERAEALATYTLTLNKQERIKGKLNPTETIFVKWKKPSMVYLKILSGKNKGREIIYVKGKNKNKMIVSPGGFLGGITIRISPYSRIATKNNRHSITEAGMASTIGRINLDIKMDMKKENKTIRISYVGIEKFKEVETIHIRVENSSYAAKTEIYLYRSSHLLYGLHSYNKSGGLLESYTYSNIKVDVKLTEYDFDPKNKEYDF